MSKWERFLDRGPSGWRRVSRDRVCPVCGRPDWCGVSGDARFAICMRVEDGAIKPTDNGGYLHRLASDAAGDAHGRALDSHRGGWGRSVERYDARARPSIDWPAMQRRLAEAIRPDYLASLAIELGVSVRSLTRLGIGYQRSPRAWAFPMVGPDGQTCGIRLRSGNGYKWAVPGSRTGLFVPTGLEPGTSEHDLLLIAEGPTDTAALLDLGFHAIGRPDCASRPRETARFASRLLRRHIVIVADQDEPGRRGADVLLQQLTACAISARCITPPDGVKDAREWVRQGATFSEVFDRIAREYKRDARRGGR